MVGKSVKLIDLRVVDLKRELEERDLDTSGAKAILQQRLRQALLDEGEDPDSFLFASFDFNKMLNEVIESNSKLESKVLESNSMLESKVSEIVTESNKNLKAEVLIKVQEFSDKLDSKVADLESNFSKLESNVSNLEDKVRTMQSELESKLESSIRLRLDALNTGAPSTSGDVRVVSAECGQVDNVIPLHQAPFGSSATHPAVPTFDGKMPWEDFMTLFDTASMVHGWSPETKASVLCLSLRGDALGVLQTMPMTERRNYSELVRRLEMRFGHRHMDQLYRSQLRSRAQKLNESLQEFEADIARLVRNAYPSVTDEVYESLAVDKFLDGLREPETQQAVKLARPKTLSDALTQAMEFEAVRQSVRGHARVRATEAEPTLSVEEIVKRVLEALKSRKREIRCWGCGQLGHPRSKCSSRIPEKGQGQLSTRHLKAPRSVNVASLGGGSSSFYVDGAVNGRDCSLLLDTGATMTILRADMVPPEDLSPTSWSLKTATGQPARVYGQTVASFVIGGCGFEHCSLVADIEEEVILGTDIMMKRGFKLDIAKGTVSIGEEELILRRRKNLGGHLRLLEDTTLPVQSRVVLAASLDGDPGQGQSVLLEPTGDDSLQLTHGVLVARSLVTTGPNVPVQLMNLNGYPVTLKRGTIVGDYTLVSSVVRQVHHSVPQSRNLPKELVRFVDETCQELTPEQRKQVKDLVTDWQDVFEVGDGPKGRTGIVKHRIDTGDAKPIRQAPRRLPLAKRDEAEGIIKEMHKDGVIEPSNSPWVSPVVLVRKKDGSTRFCVDYRQLNNVTKKDSYPLPRIDDTLDTLVGCQLFSTLDLRSGYWQVALAPEDKEKTAFSIGTGLWQFTVMPFGLCNAPATFERLMESVLRGLSWETCLVYLDDIIVLGKSFDDHLQNLKNVFERLRAANLKLNPKKCNLFRRQVSYLGHVVSNKGVSVDPDKIRAITDWPVPRDKHQVRSFIGLCTYYRRFIKGFANIARPITKLTEEKRVFNWDHDCQRTFEELKHRLSSAPILSYPRPQGRFILDTDASNTAIGSVLSQIQDDEERVIGYFSKVLSAPERNYCVTRRELLAVVKSVEHFHKYLYGRRFLLRTDHAALMWLLRFKSPEGQVARWIERLQEYDFESEHRSGSSHRNADALSRRPCEEDCKHCSRQEEKAATVKRTTVVDDTWETAALKKDQEEDPDLKHIVDWKRSGQGRPSWQDVAPLSKTVKTYWAQWDSLLTEDGLLKRTVESADGGNRRLQLVVPGKRVPDVLKELHDEASGGHLGVHRTLEKVRERFYWANLKNDVLDWCRRCTTCAASNGPVKKGKAPLRKYNVGAPFERIAIDIAGPFPITDGGNKFILVAMDYFSKWVEAYALPNQEASTVADVLVKEFFSRFGVPMELHSDQGRNFESAVFTRVCEALGIRKTRTTPLHPQSDGMVERMNRTMGRYLSKVVSDHQRDWDQYLHLFLLAYRSSVSETTGQTPASVVFGRELRLPCDLQFGLKPDEDVAGEDYVSNLRKRMDEIHERVRSNILGASDRMKERYDIKAEKGGFKQGDLVWLHNPRRRRGYCPKLQSSWEGPYEVITRINDVIYRIKKQPKGKPKVVHFNRLAPYKGDHRPVGDQQVKAVSAKESGDLAAAEQSVVAKTIYRDLFTLPKCYALAHCVAKDLRMSRGIATVFRKKYGGIRELEQQEPNLGKVLHLLRDGQHLFYLVTKVRSHQKPTYDTLRECLLDLRMELLRSGLNKIAIPRIGCGYDGLDWAVIRRMVQEIFAGSGITVVVCVFNPWDPSTRVAVENGYLCQESGSVQGQNSLKEGVVSRSRGSALSEDRRVHSSLCPPPDLPTYP